MDVNQLEFCEENYGSMNCSSELSPLSHLHQYTNQNNASQTQRSNVKGQGLCSVPITTSSVLQNTWTTCSDPCAPNHYSNTTTRAPTNFEGHFLTEGVNCFPSPLPYSEPMQELGVTEDADTDALSLLGSSMCASLVNDENLPKETADDEDAYFMDDNQEPFTEGETASHALQLYAEQCSEADASDFQPGERTFSRLMSEDNADETFYSKDGKKDDYHMVLDDVVSRSFPQLELQKSMGDQGKPKESSKVVAELLANILDDVDIPSYMDEIEHGLTSTPDGGKKDLSFVNNDSGINMSSSWSPSAEKSTANASKERVNMSKVNDASGVPPPPIPPPLLRSVSETDGSHGITPKMLIDEDTSINSTEASNKMLARLLLKEEDSIAVKMELKGVSPIVQDGPCCGLVALSMGSGLFGLETDWQNLLSVAKQKHYTFQGEMFSADELCSLGMFMLDCQGQVMDSKKENNFNEKFLWHISQKHACLVPYDADKNHEPCMKRGHKAHWALIIGVAVITSEEDASLMGSYLEEDADIPRLFHVSENSDMESFLQLLVSTPVKNLYLLAMQGKSRHVGLWSFKSLVDSNKNLVEVDPQKSESSGERFRVPPAGISQTLCNKIVVLWK